MRYFQFITHPEPIPEGSGLTPAQIEERLRKALFPAAILAQFAEVFPDPDKVYEKTDE